MMRRILVLLLFVGCFYDMFATAYYVGGASASDNNPGTASLPFATIQKAANVAAAGDIINIRSGTYRETIVPVNSGSPGNPIIYQADNGARVIISGLEPISDTGWTVHNGSIYKKTITLPVNGFNKDTFSNTQILANQLFKDGEPQIEARWPKMNNYSDVLDRSSYKNITNSTSNTITDASIPPNVTGALCWVGGWYIALTGYVTSQGGSTITWNQPQPDAGKRKRFFLTGKLNLLTQQKEFHYEAGTLYFWQQGGGSPRGLEYKARNYGFNLRANSYITVYGLEFIGCDPVVASTSSNTIIVDNIRASYLNHAIRVNWTNTPELNNAMALSYWNARQTGIRLLGPNNIIRNSELNWGIQAVWLGQNGIMDNCLAQGFGMDGNYGCGVTLWDYTSNQKILNNTMHNMGRSCMDWGSLLRDNKFNVEIAYNNWYDFERLNVDAGASYAGGFKNMDGSVLHHNWIHDSKNLWSGTGEPEEGVNAGVYWDMGSGWTTMHHNVIWNCNGNAVFTNPCFEGTNHARSNLYNNTFVDNYSTGGFYGPGGRHYMQSYKNVCSSPLDKMRNNIYGDEVMVALNSVQADNANSVMENTNPSYLQSGTGGLQYRLSASSPARNIGVHIPGITDGFLENAPDAGAYEYGDPSPWVPGYTPVSVTTTPNIPPIVSITSPANNASFIGGSPITISANASDTDGTITKVEFFSGTTKLGEDLTNPYSFDWTNAPIGTILLTARATDNQNKVTTSALVTIAINGNAAPTVSITGPSNNAQFTAGTTITIAATAADANGSVTKVEFFNGTTKLGEDLTSPYSFVWNNAPIGTLALTAKATDNENSVTTSTVVTIKVNANTPPTVAITSPSNNAPFTAGTPVPIAVTASDANGAVTKVEFFNGTTKLGEDLTSPYSFVWNNAPIGTHTLTAKATDNLNSITTSTTVTISVNVNTPPTVAITAPSNNAQFTTGNPVTITATASDTNGSVTKVEFFDGTTKLGEDLTSPYSFVWNNAAVGTHTLTAKATDDLNSIKTSTTVTITVKANTAPTVSITAPSNNAQFIAGTPITLDAAASDTDGSVTKVEFFDGTTKLGQDLTSPYSFVWNNAPAGTHVLTAKATDNLNNTKTSTAVTITVKANTAPTVSITAPSNNAQFIAGTPITLDAAASDTDGSVTKVEFFDGTTKLGQDLTSPYSFVWNNAPAGTHVLTAKATDNLNNTKTSTAVTITVYVNTAPTVLITGPSNNSQFAAGTPVTIAAAASDANGSVKKVEFFNGNIKLGEDLTSPYTFVWKNAPAGTHELTAKATDDLNTIATSKPAMITIVVNTAPTVTITGPSNNARFAAGASISIAASATDADGSVTKVEFFDGTAKLGEDPTSPYGILWSNAPVGNHSITAKATDNQGAVATSPAILISVIAPNTPPVVSITSPSDNASFLAGSSITLKATASDADGTVSKVEFFSGGKKLGVDLNSPYSFTWTNIPEGNYSITAKATDNQNKVTSSQSISISFVKPTAPIAFAGPDETLILPENEITLMGSGTSPDGSSVSFQWSQLSGPDVATLSSATDSEITLTNLTAGVYQFELTVTDQNGLTGKDQMQLSVTGTEIAMSSIPRYFTPNDDGINDFWEWPQSELFENSILMVFNRFGQQIYEAISYKNDWDGKMNGKALQEDAYYYVIRLLNNTDIKGAVRIIR